MKTLPPDSAISLIVEHGLSYTKLSPDTQKRMIALLKSAYNLGRNSDTMHISEKGNVIGRK